MLVLMNALRLNCRVFEQGSEQRHIRAHMPAESIKSLA